uniref:Uncharacterized protein n=1 Tax=Haptolina brevifila TaxID=156173 RepID=A0A7S2CH94_9EUKA
MVGLDAGAAPAPSSCSRGSAASTAGVSVPCSSTALVAGGRSLKILEHHVHKVEMRTKENGEQEEELVVSNLRPFTLKVGVHDASEEPMLDCSLPLRASLLYENGMPVKQTSSSEPLLVGETDVVALQGAATFKLRITSLSSHRDKQRFRIQVAPQDVELHLNEPNLCVVTDPMKSVTKLGRAAGGPLPQPTIPPPSDIPQAPTDGLKRKHRETLEEHAAQLQSLSDTQDHIMQELQGLIALAHQRMAAGDNGSGAAGVGDATSGLRSTRAANEYKLNGS